MAASANGNGRRLPEWGDIQGLVLSSYPQRDQAVYLLFQIKDPASARRWLSAMADLVTPALKHESSSRRRKLAGLPLDLNIAFTHTGIEMLRGGATHFSDAYEQGSYGYSREVETHPPRETHRSRALGDTGDNDPQKWDWGGPSGPRIDVLLLVYVDANDPIDDVVKELEPPANAATCVHSMKASPCSRMKGLEHFGFKDGISQPILAGSSDSERFPESIHVTALGEIVLGYPDESGRALGQTDADGRMADLPSVTGQPAFGLNGTYLVMRQLAQDVDGFWKWIRNTSGAAGNDDPRAQQLAAKLIGRWPDGTPLAPYANRDDNEFMFAEDPYGYGCPLGAHVRRANPRSDLDDKHLPVRLRNDHRILRRGRSYGPGKDGARGLLFIALNADIERQFEFIQQTWINNTSFTGLDDEIDPLVGYQGDQSRATYTIPSLPVRHCVRDLPRFVTVRGGQYFFLPGIQALKGLVRS